MFTTDEAKDARCWRSSLLIGVGFATFAMVASLFAYPLIYGAHVWIVPGDVWMVANAGRSVWSGALGYVYQNSGSYALPLSFILIAPIVALSDHLGLVQGSPFPLPEPTAWLLIGPYTLLFGIFLLYALRRLAWDLGVRKRLWVLQLLAVLVVLLPAAQWGHFEDVIALTLVLYSLRRLLRGDILTGAFLMSVAVASKQWALVLVPLFVVQAAPRKRLRCAVVACALPAAFVSSLLLVDWKDALKALFFQVNLVGKAPGHMSFYATWLGSSTSRASRTLGVLVGSAVSCLAARQRRSELLVLVAGAALLVRPFSEAINYSYYWSPALLLVGMGGLALRRQVSWRDWIWPTLALVWSMPRAQNGTWWWTGELLLLGAAAAQLALTFGLRPLPRRVLAVIGTGS